MDPISTNLSNEWIKMDFGVVTVRLSSIYIYITSITLDNRRRPYK